MRRYRGSCAALILLLLLSISPLAAADLETAVRRVLQDQVTAWNRGDVPGFAAPYAEHCTLVGKTITKVTHEQVLDHYRQKYPSPAAMGHLAFLDLDVYPLGEGFAMTTGSWHLERTESGGGPVSGVFSLVLELQDGNWRIVLDHTS